MKTQEAEQKYTAHFFRKHIEKFFKNKFPNKIKRLIYISSLTAILKQVNSPKKELSEQLNEIFNIAKHSETILFPMYVKSLIWKDYDRQIIQNLEQNTETSLDVIDSVITNLIKITPDWLRYGSFNIMKQDTDLVVKNLSRLIN